MTISITKYYSKTLRLNQINLIKIQVVQIVVHLVARAHLNNPPNRKNQAKERSPKRLRKIKGYDKNKERKRVKNRKTDQNQNQKR